MDMVNFDDMDCDELKDLIARAERELAEREFLQTAEEQANQIALQWHQTQTRNLPEGEVLDWKQPTGAHDAYPKGWKVQHNGHIWYSSTPANVWEPGVSGWRQESEDGSVPIWIAPTGAHDAYGLGEVVLHNGKYWESLVDANVWEPPEQWREDPDAGPEPELPEEPVEPEEPTDPENPEDPDDPVDPTDPEDPEEPTDPEEPEEPPAEPEIPEWSPTATYKVGDLVSLDGVVWECLVAHGEEYQGAWKPGVAHSVWREVAQ